MLDKYRQCMTEDQLVGVNVTRRAINAAIDFTCHDDGDRIACKEGAVHSNYAYHDTFSYILATLPS